MTQQSSSPQVSVLELPATAPRIRITAGVGSATQKTWNLRRPVTVIGSHRPAHIVLHDRDISPAHCLIINTGGAVLLKDLHTRCGTVCNNARIETTELHDGDVITVGNMKIQVAVQYADTAEEDDEAAMDDPTLLPFTASIGLIHTDQSWKIRESAALIGKHPNAAIHLDHQDVARRHAVVFRFCNGAAVFDLCGGRGLTVNGRINAGAQLQNGDRVTIGPFGLQVDLPPEAAMAASPPAGASATPEASGAHFIPVAPTAKVGGTAARAIELPEERDPVLEISSLSSKLDALRAQITDSWGKLNSWPAPKPTEEAGPLGKANSEGATREGDLEARDAMIRGQLHDIQRYHEQLAEREREMHQQLVALQLREQALAETQTACAQKEAEFARTHEELSRREHVVAQRWSRLMTSKCPHCGEKLSTPDDQGSR